MPSNVLLEKHFYQPLNNKFMNNPANWFEIPVADMDRAKSFYENVFGYELTVTEMGPSLMAWFPGGPDGLGATGTLIKGEGYTPSFDGSLVYLSVEDIEETLGKISDAGGDTVMPKFDIGEFGWIAHFQDSEGNRVAIHSATG